MTFHFSTSKCFNVPEWFLKSLNRKSQLVRDMTMSDCKILTCYRRHEKLAMIPKHFDHELADLVGLYTVPLHDQTHCKSSFPMLCAMVYDMEGLRKMMSDLEESENFLWAYNSFQTFDDFDSNSKHSRLCSNGDLADAGYQKEWTRKSAFVQWTLNQATVSGWKLASVTIALLSTDPNEFLRREFRLTGRRKSRE